MWKVSLKVSCFDGIPVQVDPNGMDAKRRSGFAKWLPIEPVPKITMVLSVEAETKLQLPVSLLLLLVVMSEVSKVADCVTQYVFGNGRAEDAFDVGQCVVLTQIQFRLIC